MRFIGNWQIGKEKKMMCPECGCLVEEIGREIIFTEKGEDYEATVTRVDMECPCCMWTEYRIED